MSGVIRFFIVFLLGMGFMWLYRGSDPVVSDECCISALQYQDAIYKLAEEDSASFRRILVLLDSLNK